MSDWREKTVKHISMVERILHRISNHLLDRALWHDKSKLKSPEAAIFEVYTDKLRGTTYGSGEYKVYLAEMKPALDHHYANNRHHPEFHGEGINDMTLIDLIEMLADWKAATLRHADGDIWQSLGIQEEKLGLSIQLTRIFANTIPVIEEALTDEP